jgi:hypothetical protein
MKAMTKLAYCYKPIASTRILTIARDNTITNQNKLGRFIITELHGMTAIWSTRHQSLFQAVSHANEIGYTDVIMEEC